MSKAKKKPDWYVRTSNSKDGPVSTRQMNRWIQKGSLNAQSVVSRGGWGWHKAKYYFGLVFDENFKRWYIKTSSRIRGPFSLKRLTTFASRCQVKPDTAITLDGKRWLAIDRLPQVKFASDDEPRWTVNSEHGQLLCLNELRDLAANGDLNPNDRVSVDDFKSFSAKRIAGLDFSPQSELSIVSDEVPTSLSPQHDSDAQLHDIVEDEVEANPLIEEAETGGYWIPRDLPPVPVINDPPAAIRMMPEEIDPEVLQSPAQTRLSRFKECFGDRHQLHTRETRRAKTSVAIPSVRFDIAEFHPNADRPMTTLITSGLSDYPIQIPVAPGATAINLRRVEMMMYVDRVETRTIEMLRLLGASTLVARRPIGYGVVVGNGSPPMPIFVGSMLSNFVFLVPLLAEDFEIKDSLSIDGESVQPLWVVPISNAERELIQRDGVGSFCKLCDHCQDPVVFSPGRQCYVTGAKSMLWLR